MGASTSHPLFPALRPPVGHSATESYAPLWPGVRPWHTLGGEAPMTHDEREAWLQVLARCIAFCAHEGSHPQRLRRAACLRLISRGWDAAFGRFLELNLVEGMSRITAPPPAVPPIGSFSGYPFPKPPDALPLDPLLLKYISRPNVNEALSDLFASKTLFSASVNITKHVFPDYSTMRRLRRLRGISSLQFELLPRAPLTDGVGRCVAFAFPWLRSLSLFGSLTTGSALEEFAGLPHLTELDLSWCQRLERFGGLLHFPNLVALSLQATGIDFTALYTYVSHMQDLRTLNLTNCHQLASVDFCRLLACLPKLKVLGLGGIPNPRLEPFLPRRESLLEVDLSHTKMDGETLSGWSRAPLRALGLEYCLALTAPELQVIGRLASTLVTLNLRQNGHLKSDSLVFLSSLTHLQRLSIHRCTYVDDDAMELIRDLPVVSELDLEFTAVTDRGLWCLQSWTLLQRLNINGVRCTVDSLPLLALFAERGLQLLEVSACAQLDSSAIIYLRELPGLTVRC